MTDPKPMPRDFRTGIAVGVLSCCILGIGLLNGFGDAENGIHVLTVEWSFWLIAVIVVTGALATGVPEAVEKWKR